MKDSSFKVLLHIVLNTESHSEETKCIWAGNKVNLLHWHYLSGLYALQLTTHLLSYLAHHRTTLLRSFSPRPTLHRVPTFRMNPHSQLYVKSAIRYPWIGNNRTCLNFAFTSLSSRTIMELNRKGMEIFREKQEWQWKCYLYFLRHIFIRFISSQTQTLSCFNLTAHRGLGEPKSSWPSKTHAVSIPVCSKYYIPLVISLKVMPEQHWSQQCATKADLALSHID